MSDVKMTNKDYAAQILEFIGGEDNISTAAHCATRIRLVIKNNDLVKKEELEQVEVVKGVFEASGQLQIIIGTGLVNKVFEEFAILGNITAATKEDVKNDVVSKQNKFMKLIKIVGDIFVPIMPAIIACGILMGILGGLSQIDALDGFTSSAIFKLLNMVSNSAFVGLPILICVSAAKVFKCNVMVAAALGMLMIHPDLMNAWAFDADSAEVIYDLFGWFTVYFVGYQGHVIPVIFAVYILSLAEKGIRKFVPDMLDLFVVPLLSLLVTVFIVMLFVGPVLLIVENGVVNAMSAFITLPFGIGGILVGLIYPFTVVAGVHHMYAAIELNLLSTPGLNTWMPLASCANVAQGASCLAVGCKTKDKKVKGLAISSSISAFLGITEPALFGVNLKYKKPLIAGAIGGAIGCWFVALVGVTATANGVTGLFGLLITLFSWQNLLLYIAGMLIAAAAAFIISFVTHKE